jgi:parallel beta-helix repeat protein
VSAVRNHFVNRYSQANGLGIYLHTGSTGNQIGGTARADRNLISGNTDYGLLIWQNSNGNLVQGNYIGTDKSGNNALANGAGLGNGAGVRLWAASQNVIGDAAAEGSNLISGNAGEGILIEVDDSVANQVLHNRIGTNAAGTGALGNGTHGVSINNGGVNIIGSDQADKGNLISGNGQDGVYITGIMATLNRVIGNLIGTDVNGTGVIANQQQEKGIEINGADANLIGGSTLPERNVISGNLSAGISLTNSSNTKIQGNYIGTTKNGGAPLANTGGGIYISGGVNNLIGGSVDTERNVISGNTTYGIEINGSNSNQVKHNYIGLDKDGTGEVGNTDDGILITNGSQGNVIGGPTVVADRNIISGHYINKNGAGVRIRGASTSFNRVEGNIIGMDAAGMNRKKNGWGVVIETQAPDNTIGGPTPAHGNFISGNARKGIDAGSAGPRTTIQNNTGGKNMNGTALPNDEGGIVVGGSESVIEDNDIAFNGGPGLEVVAGTGHIIHNNLIEDNTGLAISIASATSLAGYSSVTGDVQNDGLLVVQDGTLSISGTLTHSTLDAETDVDAGLTLALGSFAQSAGTLLLNGGILTASGNFDQDDGTTSLETGSTITVSGTLSVDGGVLTLDDGSLTATAGLSLGSSGTVSGYGSITADVQNDGLLLAEGGTLSIDGTFSQEDAGASTEVDWSSTLSVDSLAQTTGDVLVNGTLDVAGNLSLSGGDLTVNAALTVGGDFDQDGGTTSLASIGTTTVSGALTVDGGVLGLASGYLTATSGISIGASGTLSGQGSITGNVANAGLLLAEDGTLTIAGTLSQSTSAASSDVASGGTLSLDDLSLSDGMLTVDGTLTVNSNFDQDGGTASLGAGSMVNVWGSLGLDGGTLALAGGYLTATSGFTIGSSATLSGQGSVMGSVENAGLLLAEDGTLTIDGMLSQSDPAASVEVASGATLSLYDCSLADGMLTVDGTLTINGNFDQDGGTASLASTGTASVSGSLTLDGGTLDLDGSDLTATSTISIGASGTLSGHGSVTGSVDNAGLLLAEDGTLGINGMLSQSSSAATIEIAAGATLPLSDLWLSGGTLTVDGTLTASGSFDQDGGTAVLASSGTATVSGYLTLDGGTLDLGGGDLTASSGLSVGSSGTLVGDGTITGDVQNEGTLQAQSLIILGAFTQSGGTTTVGSNSLEVTGDSYLNGGSLTVASGLVDVGGALHIGSGASLVSTSATVQADGGLFLDMGGSLSGSGDVLADVTNAGILSVQSGGLAISGDYTQSSAGELSMQGWASGGLYGADVLSISGLAEFDGTLDFSVSGDAPDIGMVFSLVTFNAYSGGFAALNLPAVGSGFWDPRYDDPLGTFSLWVVE